MPYRTGMIQRKSGWFSHTYSLEDLRLELNGASLSDPLTGQTALYRIPLHQTGEIRSLATGSRRELRIQTRDHYIIKPRTYLNYDESDFSYRHLEFAWQQPLAEATHLELSYWDRRDGTGYSRADSRGNQIAAQLRHKLSANRVLRVGLWQNQAEKEESFGYVTQAPDLFAYNRFTAQPNASSARSEELFRDLVLQVQEGDSARGDVMRSVGFAVKGARRDLFAVGEAGPDTTATHLRSWEVFARVGLGSGAGVGAGAGSGAGSGSGASLEMRGYYLQNRDQSRLSGRGWLGGELRASARFGGRRVSGVGVVLAEGRDDGRIGAEVSGRLTLRVVPGWRATGFAAVARRTPDLQSLYWVGEEYHGIEDAPQEVHVLVGTEHQIDAGRYWNAGLRAEWRTVADETGPDLLVRRFVTRSRVDRQSVSVWLRMDDRRRWEGKVFAGYLRLDAGQSGAGVDLATGTDLGAGANLDSGIEIWNGVEEVVRLGAELFVKGPVFRQAAYVKAGFRGSFVPYQTALAMYDPVLNRWQMSGVGDAGLASFQQGQSYRRTEMPAYFRTDAEISARIRWFMMLLRWENATDGIGQVGMMETLGYPMPSRRLLLSLRVLFLN